MQYARFTNRPLQRMCSQFISRYLDVNYGSSPGL